jgi:hypothetical protein
LVGCFLAPLGDGVDSGPRLLFKGVGSGRTNAPSAMTSAVRVAINAPSALISFEVDSSILVMVALWWISLLSIAVKRVSCSLSIFVIRVSCAAMRSIKASILVRGLVAAVFVADGVAGFVVCFYVAFCEASSSGTGSVGVLLPGSVGDIISRISRR